MPDLAVFAAAQKSFSHYPHCPQPTVGAAFRLFKPFSLCYNPSHANAVFRMEEKQLVVVNRMRRGQTTIPNAFIDKYMVDAGGEYVKVYLMLLRMMYEAVSVPALADALEFTEKDIVRALSYWEKQGLLTMRFEDGEIKEISVTDLPEERAAEQPPQKGSEQTSRLAEKTSAAPAAPAAKQPTEKILRIDPEFKQLIFVIEQYLGKTLTKTETEHFVRICGEGGLPVDVVEILVEYCASIGKTNVRYIKAVAEKWIESGIKDAAGANAQIKAFAEASASAGSTGRPKNKFHNFTQRTDGLNDLMYEELRDGK